MFHLKRAWTSASTPLSIVCPADHAVPPDRRYVFVDDCQAAFSEHSAHLVEHEPWILRVMQHVAEQHGVETLVFDGKVPAIVRKIIDASRGAGADVQSNHGRSEDALEMVRDEAVTAAYIEYVSARRQHTRDFKRHVVSSSDFTAPSHAREATFDGCG